ncbi:MAG: aminotransferase class V-fold PLP-dependent enzyme [Alphaproteobacteria bacterium]|nr:aminotransferase class V-fold PLP-dependent enzyme [Alphaproteobacteria bacterium]
MDARVLEAMMPYLTSNFGNPHSTQHVFGQDAEDAVETARKEIATLIGADSREIVFTSGATEANNLAIIGAGRFRQRIGDGIARVLTFATEHKCVLASVAALAEEGFESEVLPVQPDGLIDLGLLEEKLKVPTTLVSLMAVNNEIGTIQPIAEAARLTRAAEALLHVDAAQATGKIPLDMSTTDIDLLSISAHKMYGPKGIGALYIRRRPRARVLPLIHGGGQERGFRSGTLPAPLCVGFGKAAVLAKAEMAAEAERLARIRSSFLSALNKAGARYTINASMERRTTGNLNLQFDGADALPLINAAPDVAISTGSACSSASVEPSYVLKAIGLSPIDAARSVRIAFGRQTTEAEAVRAAELLARAAADIARINAAAE